MPVERRRTQCRRRSATASTRETCVSFGTAGNLVDDVLPGVAAVAAHLEVAVVGADPDRLPGTTGDSLIVTMLLYDAAPSCFDAIGAVPGDAHDRPIVAADVPGQVRRGHPRVAAVVRTEQPIAAEIDRARVVRREDERRVPVEAVVRAWRRRRNDVAGWRCAPKPNCAAPPGRGIRRLAGAAGRRRRVLAAAVRAAGCCCSGRREDRRGWCRRPATRSRGWSSPSDRSAV